MNYKELEVSLVVFIASAIFALGFVLGYYL